MDKSGDGFINFDEFAYHCIDKGLHLAKEAKKPKEE